MSTPIVHLSTCPPSAWVSLPFLPSQLSPLIPSIWVLPTCKFHFTYPCTYPTSCCFSAGHENFLSNEWKAAEGQGKHAQPHNLSWQTSLVWHNLTLVCQQDLIPVKLTPIADHDHKTATIVKQVSPGRQYWKNSRINVLRRDCVWVQGSGDGVIVQAYLAVCM